MDFKEYYESTEYGKVVKLEDLEPDEICEFAQLFAYLKVGEEKEEIRQMLIADDYEMLAEKI